MRPLLKLNPHFRRYGGRLFLGMVFIALSNLFAVYSPQVVREAFDLIAEGFAQRGLPADQRSLEVPRMLHAWTSWAGLDIQGGMIDLREDGALVGTIVGLAGLLALLYLVFAILKGFFMFLMRQTIIVMSRLIEYDMKNEVFDHYQRLDRAFYKRNSTGDLMNRISEDVGKVRMYLGPAVMYTINLVVLFIMCIAFMVSVNPTLTLWTLAPLPIMSVAIYYVSDVMNRRSMEVQRHQSRISTMAQESFSGIRVLKAHAREASVAGRFSDVASGYRSAQLDLARVDALFMPAIMLLIGLSTVLTIFIGGRMLIAGDPTVSVGNIAEFVIYVNMLTWPFASVGWVTSLVQQASASMARIDEFLSTEPGISAPAGGPSTIEGTVEFDHVGFVYPDTGVEALKDVSFRVPQGSSLAITGRTGAGKSTIAELIARQFDATTGEVRIDGIPIKRIDPQVLRGALGVVPQEVFLFSDTIRANIAFSMDPDEEEHERVVAAARVAQVHEDIATFPKGYDTMLGERGITLSGGQKQRVSIARAIVRKPSILLFDDPLSAVDTATEDAILTGLRSLMEGRTTIIISHRISAVKHADHIIVLEEGKVQEQGDHRTLLEMDGAYAKLHKEQLLEAMRGTGDRAQAL